MTTHDELLDQYIDALKSGRRPDMRTDDPDLAELFRTATLVHALTEPEWPPASFAADMASRLSNQLTVKSNGHAVLTPGDQLNDATVSNPWVGEPSEPARLEAIPPRKSRLRQSLQIAGALAAFAAFAMVLAMSFREDDAGAPVAAPPVGSQVHEIAFAAHAGGNVDVYVVNSDGSDLRNVTDNPAIDSQPQWSPKGDRIAFISDRNGLSHIYTMNPDGSDVNQVTTGPYQYGDPKWSPDGRMVAALRYDEDDTNFHSSRLVVVMADGTDEWEITRHEWPTASSMFTWSPDSDEIAVSIGLSGRGPQILIYSVDGSDVRTLYESEGFQLFPAWSPDGSRIMFVESGTPVPDHGGNLLVEVNLDTETARILYDSDSNIFDPAWSPNSNSIALSTFDPADHRGIVIITTGETVEVSSPEETNESDRPATWSPDSTQIAFVRGNVPSGDERTQVLMVMNANGIKLTQLAIDVTADAPSWRPDRSESQDAPAPTAVIDPTPTSEGFGPDSETFRLIADSGQVEGNVAYVINYDGETENFLTGGWADVELGESTLHARPGSEVRLALPSNETVPDEINVSFYRLDDNTSETNQTFSLLTPPIQEIELDPDTLTFALPETSDGYAALVSLTWADPPAEGLPMSQLVMGVVFNVTVANDAPTEHDPNIYDAIEIVRQFLMDPEAELDVRHVLANRYEALRYIDGIDSPDMFIVDVDHDYVSAAIFEGRSSLYLPSDPIDENMALAIAEHHLWMWAPGFDEMRLHQSEVLQSGGTGNDDPVLHTSWAAHDEETGAWLPPRATILVNMETGQVVSFHQTVATFEHSTVYTITAEQAEAIALDEAAATQGDDVTYVVESVELHGYEDAYPISSNLVWQVHVTPRSFLYMVDAHTGEIATIDYTGRKDLMPDSDTVVEPTTNERNADELISKGDVLSILQDAFGMPLDGVNLILDQSPDGRWLYSVNRVEDDVVDSFIVDASSGTILSVEFASRQPALSNGAAIDEDTALQMALDVAGRMAPRFPNMILFHEEVVAFIDRGVEGSNYTVSWSLYDAESGAWIHPNIFVVISLDVGEVLYVSQVPHEYDGPTSYVITEDEAVQLAREIAGEIYPAALMGNLDRVELVGVVPLAGSRGAGEPPETTHRLVWNVFIDGVPITSIDAITGEPVQ